MSRWNAASRCTVSFCRGAYLDHRVVFWVYVAFTVEDVLESKPFAMWPTNAACILCILAAGLSPWARNGARLTGFHPVETKPLNGLLAPGLSFVVQVYGVESERSGAGAGARWAGRNTMSALSYSSSEIHVTWCLLPIVVGVVAAVFGGPGGRGEREEMGKWENGRTSVRVRMERVRSEDER